MKPDAVVDVKQQLNRSSILTNRTTDNVDDKRFVGNSFDSIFCRITLVRPLKFTKTKLHSDRHHIQPSQS